MLIARGRDETDPLEGPPWPLSKREVMQFESLGLTCESFEDYVDPQEPDVRRFRMVFRRAE